MNNSADITEKSGHKKQRWLKRAIAMVLAAALLLEVIVVASGRVTLKSSGEGDAADTAAEYLLDSTAYTSQGAWTRAKWALRSGLRKPRTYGDYEVLASVTLAREEYDAALGYLDECILLYDGGEAGLAALWMKKACVQALLTDTDGALASLKEMWDLGYRSESAYLLRAQLYYAQENYALAEEDLAAYIAYVPEDLQMLAALGELAYANGHWQRAADCFTPLLQLPGSQYYSHELWLSRANCYLQLRRMADGIADCDEYIRLAGEGDGSPLFFRAVMRATLADTAAAREDYLRAAELGCAETAICYEQAALCSYELKEYAACLSWGKQALSDGGALNSEAILYEDMGLSAMALAEYDTAEAWMNRALETDAALVELYYYRGVVRLTQHKSREAIEDFTAAIEAGQNPALCSYNRAVAYLELEEYEPALADLESAAASEDTQLAAQAQELLEALQGD